MQTGPAPRQACRVNLGLQPDSDWSQCESALRGSSAKAIAVVTRSDAWYPTSQSELEKAIQQATVRSGNWPAVIGVTYSV